MLASRKQEWVVSSPPEVDKKAIKVRCLDVKLRKKCCSVAILLLLLVCIATLQSERIISTGYQYVKIQSELKALERENEKLRIEIARLKSLQRIQSIAVNDLGMTMPKHVLEKQQSAHSMLAAVKGQTILQRQL